MSLNRSLSFLDLGELVNALYGLASRSLLYLLLSRTLRVWPAQLPSVGMPCFLHVSFRAHRIPLGNYRRRLMGDSMKVTESPDCTCHSIRQWNRNTPGLFAWNCSTMAPPAVTFIRDAYNCFISCISYDYYIINIITYGKNA